MRKPRMLRALLSYLVAEHICHPPDQSTDWIYVPEAAVVRAGGDIYACPECGQRMARSQTRKSAA